MNRTVKIISTSPRGDSAILQFETEQNKKYARFMLGFIAAGWRFERSQVTPYIYTITVPSVITKGLGKFLRKVNDTMQVNGANQFEDYLVQVSND